MRGRGQPTEMAIAIFGSGDCPVGTYSGERLIGCIEPVDLDHPKDSVATEAFYGKPVLPYGTGWRQRFPVQVSQFSRWSSQVWAANRG
jgi:hypothetical protein